MTIASKSFNYSKSADTIQVLSVGTSAVTSSAIAVKDFYSLTLMFKATTFAGTPNTTDFVKISKVEVTKDGSNWDELDITSDSLFLTPGNFSIVEKSQVKNNETIGYLGFRDVSFMPYTHIRVSFISSDAGNTVVLHALLDTPQTAPVL